MEPAKTGPVLSTHYLMEKENELMMNKSYASANTKFRQQTMDVWTPKMTRFKSIILCSSLAALLIVIGIPVFVFGRMIPQTDPFYYEDCSTPICLVNITVDEKFPTPIYVYLHFYGIYHNHRTYVKSRDEKQLRAASSDSVPDCPPLSAYSDYDGALGDFPNATLGGLVLYPCGLVATSFSTDSILSSCVIRAGSSASNCTAVADWTSSGIAFTSDKNSKFISQPLKPTMTRQSPRGFTLPAVDDEHFIVWMRSAALSEFDKLYAKIPDTSLESGDTLSLTIQSSYNVLDYGARKGIVLLSQSQLGGKQIFLGATFLVVGFLCGCSALFVLFITRCCDSYKPDPTKGL